MKRLALIFFLLAFPAGAYAGGWATAGLSSTPEGVAPGKTWSVDITLMQHGRTPLEGVQPAVVVTDKAGKDTRFAAKPTGKAGVYRAEVVFVTAGRYEYTVDDGFGNGFPHEFPPAVITGSAASPAAPGRPGSDGTPGWLLALAAVGLVALGGGLLRRRRGRAPLPA
jgi:hypothetical protein